ncbi:MAG: signal peptidase II [Verrucomicrobia bacterium GWC2_42_7]|nr:MAG: signal peptidase II [Verrucomicrobia bacterium GWC2_42_7]
MRYLRFIGVFCLIVLLDQWTKALVLERIPAGTYIAPIPVIKPCLYLVHIYNTGAAWGLFAGKNLWLILLACIALIGIFVCRKSLFLHEKWMQYAFGLFCGGVFGNLIDRVQHNHVIDFVDFHIVNYRWPAFNIADMAICIGAILYFFLSINYSKHS